MPLSSAPSSTGGSRAGARPRTRPRRFRAWLSRPADSCRAGGSRHVRILDYAAQRARRAGAMRVASLPVASQLGDCPLLAVGHEHRVVAEALAAARLVGNAPLERAGAAKLLAGGRERHELAHVAGAAVLDALELAEELADRGRALGRVARGVEPGPAAERRDLETGVLADHPHFRVADLASEARLGARVLVVRRARLRWKRGRIHRLDRPAGEEPLQLARLVLVARAEARPHSLHRTSSTPSSCATAETILAAQ